MNKLICPDQESLMAVAMGEPCDSHVETHLEECTACRSQVDRLRFMVTSMRKTLSGSQLAETQTSPSVPTSGVADKLTDAPTSVMERPAALGKYLIVGELGRGGQAQVFRALHPTLGRDVAIKWSRKDVDHDAAARLAQEGKVLADLDHPGIVRIFDLDFCEDRPFLVMEYVRGCDLEQYASRQKIAPVEAADIVARLARALAAAHARNVIHQDIKPANVLVDEAGQPRLSDFGIARIRDLWSGKESDQPIGGTLGYMAPEQLAKPDTVCPASDLFALGGVLFFLLTGKAPRKHVDNPALAFDQIVKGPIDFTPLDNPKVPRRLAEICRKAMAFDIKDRYQKAEELAADLESVARPKRFGDGWHGGMLLAACLTGVLLLFAAFTFFRPGPQPLVPVAASADSVAGTFTIVLVRGDQQYVLKTRSALESKLPLRDKDKIGIVGKAPANQQLALFAVTLTDAEPKVTFEPLTFADGRFELKGKVLPLGGAPSTDLLFVCGQPGHAPTQDEVVATLADVLADRKTPEAKKLMLPPNVLVAFQTNQVDAPSSSRIGSAEDAPMMLVADKLEKIRAKLKEKFEFVAGFAFTLQPESDKGDQTLTQVGGPRPDEPRITDHHATIEGGTVDDQKLFQEVMDRLLQTKLVRDTFPTEYAFPPKITIKPNSAKEFNAYAAHAPFQDANGKFPTEVLITQGYMKEIVKGQPDVLAAIMGHELIHLIKRHPVYYNQKELVFRAFSRDQEIEADLEGVKIAMAANFSWEAGVKAALMELKSPKLAKYSNFEGLSATHPSWEERLAFLDKHREDFWKSMAAFQNGYFFLHAEQYASAAECFETVTKEFPDCAEGWANLGYARLMLYCDSLTEGDLQKRGIGQFVAGCFYARPPDLAGREVDAKELWKQAVAALNRAETEASRGGKKLILAKANLGLAYLVHYNGRGDDDQNIKLALQFFRAAEGNEDTGLVGLSRAAFLINYGVVEQALGMFDAAADKYRLARVVLPTVKSFSSLPSALNLAITYNEAFMNADKLATKDNAFNGLTNYLLLAPTTSMWWPLAYEKYQKLATDLGRAPQTKEQLAKRFVPEMPRLQTAAEVQKGKLIILSADTTRTLAALGRAHAIGVPVIPAKNKLVGPMKRYYNAAPGVDLLANNKILAIFLTNPAAPPIVVQAEGLGTSRKELRVGMTTEALNQVLKGEPNERRYLDNAAIDYLFYPRLGLGVRLTGNQVTEIVLAQVPRKQAI